MLSTTTLLIAGLTWLGLLFAVAVAGERVPERFRRIWTVVYTLSLAVHCTAWTFYGVTTQAVRSGWPIPPTFVGAILLFTLIWPFLYRLIELAKAHNSTSIADFIASRFGKSSALAAVVTAVHWWTETGRGDFGLHFVRDKEKREVDFLVTRDQNPWFLVEVKRSGKAGLSESLAHFQQQTRAAHAFQVAMDLDFVERDCFEIHKPVIVPAKTFLAQLV